MLNTNVLSDVGLQLPHDFLVYLGWSLDAGEVRALRSQLRLRLGVRCLRLDLRLIDVAALRVIVFIPLIAAVGRRLRLVLVLRAMLGMLVLLRWHLIVFGISSACAGTSPHRTCSSLLWSLLELVVGSGLVGIIVTIAIEVFFILEYALKIHPILQLIAAPLPQVDLCRVDGNIVYAPCDLSDFSQISGKLYFVELLAVVVAGFVEHFELVLYGLRAHVLLAAAGDDRGPHGAGTHRATDTHAQIASAIGFIILHQFLMSLFKQSLCQRSI